MFVRGCLSVRECPRGLSEVVSEGVSVCMKVLEGKGPER